MDIERIGEFVSNHWIMSSAWFVVTLLLIQDLYDIATRKYRSTSPLAAVSLINQEDALVLDVREPDEFAKGHILHAKHIMFSKLDERMHELEDYKHKPILVVCQQGTRSAAACKKLVKAGFTQVHELRGGLLAWEDAKLPLTRKSS